MVEQIVRAAFYKEIKKQDYRELEYAQHDYIVCIAFIKLDGRKPFSFELFHKYISIDKGRVIEEVQGWDKQYNDARSQSRSRQEHKDRQHSSRD